jgi:demethylmenaquinone methyltransferase/2-methoxy-6-polyprenyl-1,4-benzoquinol methylase
LKCGDAPRDASFDRLRRLLRASGSALWQKTNSLTLPDRANKAAAVEAMFDRIAPRYDRLNRVLSCRLDRRWRRTLIDLAAVGRADVVVDLGCGTGDLCALAAATGARVIGVDFAARMLAVLRQRRVRAAVVRADAAALPLPTACATVVTSGFALRNFVSIPAVLHEAARILAPRGRLALLEIDEPRGRLRRWGHRWYFHRVVPVLGAWLADRAAYAYLPRSAAYLPCEAELLGMIRAAGFTALRKRRLSGGVAQAIVAERAAA